MNLFLTTAFKCLVLVLLLSTAHGGKAKKRGSDDFGHVGDLQASNAVADGIGKGGGKGGGGKGGGVKGGKGGGGKGGKKGKSGGKMGKNFCSAAKGNPRQQCERDQVCRCECVPREPPNQPTPEPTRNGGPRVATATLSCREEMSGEPCENISACSEQCSRSDPLESISFFFSERTCPESSNGQMFSFFSCTQDQPFDLDPQATYTVVVETEDFQDLFTGMISLGNSFDVPLNGYQGRVLVSIDSQGETPLEETSVQRIEFSTDCEDSLGLADTFGALQVLGFETPGGVTSSCLTSVVFSRTFTSLSENDSLDLRSITLRFVEFDFVIEVFDELTVIPPLSSFTLVGEPSLFVTFPGAQNFVSTGALSITGGTPVVFIVTGELQVILS